MNKEGVKPGPPPPEGNPQSVFSAAADRAALWTFCSSQEYRPPTFHWTATPAETPHRVNLQYTINEGEREYVRDVLLSGLKATRPGFLHSNLAVAKGDPLSFNEIRQSQRELYDLGVFAKVNTAVQNSDGAETQKY